MGKKYVRLFFLISINVLNLQATYAQSNCTGGGDQDGGLGGSLLNPIKKLYDWVITGMSTQDPNEIRGQNGYAIKKWVSVNDRLGYTISFENDGQFANSPAQNVFLYLKVNPQIDINSLKLKSFGFGKYNFYVPDNTSNYTQRLDLTDSLGIYVDVTSGIDIVNNDIFWFFKSIDPATGQTPNDSRGFLAVSDTGGAKLSDSTFKGQGYVSFSIIAAKNLQTGDTLPAQASIVFDVNEALLTNTWTNTIDAVGPTSRIDSAIVNGTNIDLTWSGQDDAGGSGIRDFALYYSENGGIFKLYKDGITTQTTTFTGTPGKNYCFYIIATDNTGNREIAKKNCEYSTGSPLPITWLYFKGQPKNKDVLLTWATVSEKNSKEFVVERSLDSRLFTPIGTVSGSGNSNITNNYAYTDIDAMSAPTKVLFYRLKQVDIDGRFKYSIIVAIPIPQNRNEPYVRAYPNPFNQNITLEILNMTASNKKDAVELYSLEGKLLYRRSIINLGSSTVLLNDLPNLTSGTYMLRAVINRKLFAIKMLRE